MRRMIKIVHIFVYVMLFSGFVKSQEMYQVHVKVLDDRNEKGLQSVVVHVNEFLQTEITDQNGDCIFNLPSGVYTYELRLLGYMPKSTKIRVSGSDHLKIMLTPTSFDIEEVRVVQSSGFTSGKGDGLSSMSLSQQDLSSIANFGGISDPLKAIQFLPGVSSGGDGRSEFHVRGGSYGQNVVILDNAPVFNPNHLLGFFSVFNPEVISSLKLYKGNMPASRGGRASSITDIKLRNGDANKLSYSMMVGNIASEMTCDIPLQKGKSSILISGRKAYPDIYLGASTNKKLKESKLNFYDLNIKTSSIINEHQRISLSFYSGQDKMSTQNIFTQWANKVASINWDQTYGEHLYSRTSLFGNKFDYESGYEAQNQFSLGGGLSTIGGKQDFIYQINKNTAASMGFSTQYDRFSAGDLNIIANKEVISHLDFPSSSANESAVFFAGNLTLLSKLHVDFGTRFSFFKRDGNYGQNIQKSEAIYQEGEVYPEASVSYNKFEPRLNIRYSLSQNQLIVACYNRMAQYIHLLQSNSTYVPMDYWISSSGNIKPQLTDQWTLGYKMDVHESRGLEFSAEWYYKKLGNAMDYKSGADILMNNNVEEELIFGKGRAYGLEFLLKKQTGVIRGWMSYTLSRSELKMEGINDNSWYPAQQDRTHDFSIVLTGQLSKNVSLTANWVYYTGKAVTFPVGKYLLSGSVVNLYGDRNQNRMPDYHRLDVGAKWILKKNGSGETYFDFSLFNAYGRKNTYSIIFNEEDELSGVTQSVKVYLFSVVPSISMGYKF